MNNKNNDKQKKTKTVTKFASKKAFACNELDAMFDKFSESLDLAIKLGYKECAVCKTMSKSDSSCETCAKPRTEYAEDVVLSNEDMFKGFDRMIEWADKKKKEEKK
jgi:recombinational DNA repair protein RecR